MEGKGILFKRFADADVFDIEIVKMMEPAFGGINLEDITPL